ncbi:unnamed protein product [Durusdinium trenchii]|uniref:Glycosyl transferase CAP10 domain-containing protein n=1 Tax=Durusdinium trenchii TaxID=1381693 RepID=A0ABP0SV54_9DINO
MAKAAFAVLGAVAAQSLDLDCPGPWIEFRGKLYQAANPNIRHFAIASQEVLSLAGKFQAERPSTSSGDCPLGEAALRIIESLQIGEGVEAVTIASDFELLEALGWSALVRSGWPIFQLLYLLHKHAKPQHPRDPSSTCFQMDNYARTLQRALQHQPKPGDVGLTASSWSFLSRKIAASCSSLASAAIVAIAWARLPVYDIETEGLLYQAQQLTFLADLAFAHADHPLPLVVARFAAAQQLSVHFIESDDEERSADCVVRFAGTPSGSCNFFAPIWQGLRPWQSRGVYLEDQVRAFRPTTDQKTVLFRLIGDELVQVIPTHSHLDVDFGATEPTCLAHALLDLLASVELPDFDIVLNHGDLPLLRKASHKPPFYGPMDKEARTPAPLFSICASEDFWDILFPNVCRPALVNMSGMSPIPWEQKLPIAFWRGTDRGAVNWAIEVRDMYKGSPRKRFLDAWADNDDFDMAFLDDDLLNATVVNTDPSFVPLDQWPRRRYLLDLPGNGYSGSLKQKLTASSAVLFLNDVKVHGATPVYEHYHGGLQDRRHILLIGMDDAGEKVRWAQEHDDDMQEMVRNANRYMESFEKLTQCYLWFLITRFASILRYQPHHEQTPAFGPVSVRTMVVHRRPLRRESAAFKNECERLRADSEK